MAEVIEGVAVGRRGVVSREVGMRAAGPVALLVFALALCAPVLSGQVPVASDNPLICTVCPRRLGVV